MTFVEPVYLSGAIHHVPRAFLRCTMTELLDEGDVDPIEAMTRRAADGFWHYRELQVAHDPHLSNPSLTVRALTELVVNVLEKLPDTSVQLPSQARADVANEKQKERVDWVWSPS